MAKQTFAQYLINKSLPPGIRIDKPMDSSELRRVLLETQKKYPDRYDDVVMHLKRIGDKFSTLEGITVGMDEIAVPNKSKRDALISKYKNLFDNSKTDEERLTYQDKLQKALIENDLKGMNDDASLMINAGAVSGGKRLQVLKMRTSPVMVSDYQGNVVPEIFDKSFSEGHSILHHWLQAAESRRNLVGTSLATSGPGEMSKVVNNLMNESVVSKDDCGTKHGLQFFSKDDDILDRYLAAKSGKYPRNTLVTPEIQQDLMKKGVKNVLVRSPQTCEAGGRTVCSKCMGINPLTGKKYEIGLNAGSMSAGILSEPLTQLTISSKHSVTMAEKEVGLKGEQGFRTWTTMPKEYPNKKILCELYGKVYRIRRAAQGGFYIIIRQTRKVPDRYILNAKPVENMKNFMQYHVPPQRKIVEGIEENVDVYPGMELTDGIDNLKDIARLKNLGVARSAAAEGMRNIYRDTGQTLDRRHFELLSRNMMSHVKLEKVPSGFPYNRGDVIEYNALKKAMEKVNAKPMRVDLALGAVLAEPINQFSAGTELTTAIINEMKRSGIDRVKATHDVDVSPMIAPIISAMNIRDTQWIGKLNHRHIKASLRNAAMEGQRSDIHGYNPISAYAYGVEMRQDEQGRY